ncbi:ElaB/YqjD/DUF883 family membrane-anchored ribosome-binding protein [Paucimonas lemoignei]|uniref:ElaB/YqjD/DUF883 family membrane-anchored ribosome-binding protein n=1 Tax=Paucimonas lemoignei TaxID=29443 RepID=A0A4V2UJ15_PAULE|nr:DUF883 family protein [Paucimonas lemoignei]TCS38280.1 ElaB/YqjD/DUF883 family membrane-anchored ribosome-binding protein [Paucimonas lemoignei]
MDYSSTNSSDSMGKDMKNAARDATDTLKATGQQLGEQMSEQYRNARSKFQDTFSQAKSNFSDIQENVSERTRTAMDSTDQYVRDNPWQAVGIGAAIGVVLGFLMMRR